MSGPGMCTLPHPLLPLTYTHTPHVSHSSLRRRPEPPYMMVFVICNTVDILVQIISVRTLYLHPLVHGQCTWHVCVQALAVLDGAHEEAETSIGSSKRVQ